MDKTKTNVHYKVKSVSFDHYGDDNLAVAVVRGIATINREVANFELIIKPVDDGQWQIVHLGWQEHSIPTVLLEKQFYQPLLNYSARLLDTINTWPSKQTKDGAITSMNKRVIPEDVQEKTIVSFRPNILDIPSASWNHLWDQIERRVVADPFFEILGFDKETVKQVLPIIKETFPLKWVSARYASAGLSGMADKFEAGCDGWFPAYHLARTAHGAICRDPGWNYLIEIGLAIEALQSFDGLDRLKRRLTNSPGTQHHLCLAAELYQRGLLQGLEPLTGAGTASNDLLVGTGKNLFQVEVKEFTSLNPGKKLKKEIADKTRKLPNTPRNPIVFHVVLNENGQFNKIQEENFFQTVAELEGDLPDNISAVIAGKRFVDSKGGCVKRDIERIITNATARMMIDKDYLKEVFRANYGEVTYPIYGIGTLFSFEITSGSSKPAQ